MKNISKVTGLIVLIAISGLLCAACGGGAGGGPGEGYLISGKFDSQRGTGNTVFYADYASNARSVRASEVGQPGARSVGGLAATEKELVGKIEDGDIVFNLKGVYDTTTDKFFLSAGSSVLIYQVAGTLSASGTMSDASAAVKVNSGTEWITYEVPVTATGNTEIADAASATQEDGIPSAWFGLWEYTDEEVTHEMIVSSFQLIALEYPNEPAGIVEVETITPGEEYNVIYHFYVHYYPEGGEDIVTQEYMKTVIKADGANLKWTWYVDSLNTKFATTKAYNTAGALDIVTFTLHRP